MKKIVIIGAGKIGCAHLEAFLRKISFWILKGYKIGFCSRNEERRKGHMDTGNNLGVKVREKISAADLKKLAIYSSVEDVLADPEVYAVIICTPTDEHMPIAKLFDEKGVHVMVEKPVGFTPDEVEDFVKNGNPNSKRAVAHILPFFPAYAALSQALDSGAYGNVTDVRMERFVNNSNPNNEPTNRAKSKTPVFDLNVHCIHYAVKTFGRPNQIRVTDRKLHPNDGTFISRLYFELLYSWGRISISGGAYDNDDVAFHHSYSLKFDTDVEILMSPQETQWNAMLRVPGSADANLMVPEFYDDTEPDIAPFVAEQQKFEAVISGEDDDLGALNPSLAMEAVSIACLLEESALGASSNWQPITL